MLLDTTDTRERTGNFEGEKIKVGISDMRLIIDRLTDMYADREMACIREYSCNARDAHIEAGKADQPIRVSLPGPLAPYLTIQDFGTGLTVEDIREIYSQYGASTKRLTNDQTGAFGLGCKSALSYSDQFTVTSIKDGTRIQVVVSRDPVHGVVMEVGDPEATDEANGTTVLIPAKANNDFKRKARDFFQHWRPGTVIVDGVQPEFMPGADKVTDEIYITQTRGYNSESVAVMGGVPYPVKIEHGLGWSKSVTVFVPIGSMDIPGNRESVIDTDKTVKTLAKAKQDFRDGLHDAIRREVENAGSPAEAATMARRWRSTVGNGNFPTDVRYKGRDVPDSYKVEHDGTILAPLHGSKQSAHSTYRADAYIPLPTINDSVWVTGFDYASFTATVKKKLVKWCEDNDLDVTPQMFVLWAKNGKPDTTWLENVTFIDWPTVKAIKLPKASRQATASGRIPGSYDIYENGDANEDVPADDIDTSNPIFWVIGRMYYQRPLADYLAKSYPGSTLVCMRDGRQDKFQRLFPGAKNATKTVRDDFAAWIKGLDKDDLRARAMRESCDRRVKLLDMARVNDPEVKALGKIINRDLTQMDAEVKEWQRVGHYFDRSPSSASDNPLDKYPLLPDAYYFDRFMKNKADAIYRYMNCEYAFQAAQQKGDDS